MMQNKKVYILYDYDKFKNDYNFIKEYQTIGELQKDNNIILKNKNSIYHFIYKTLSDNMHLLKDKYIIIQDTLEKDF